MVNSRQIAVLIPCYNEAGTIAAVIKNFRNELPDASIYVYDNNSTDGTAEIAALSGAIVRHEYKQGKGNVICAMFRDIEADYYLMVDGDDTYPAESAMVLLGEAIENGKDVVIGDRLSSTYFTENKRPLHNSGNKLVRWLINKIFDNSIKDIMSGYRVFSYDFVKTFPILSKGFEIETEMTIHALDKGFNISEIAIAYRNRPEGSVSKLNTLSDGFKVLLTIFNLFKDTRPFLFFGTLSIILFVVSVVAFIPILLQYIEVGLVPNFPTLIVASIVMVLSLLFFVCGLILDSLRKQYLQSFQIERNKMRLFKTLYKNNL
ncbi:glycosyltransferase family 2 protein [Candidatus Symbiothrix dinenymphae]|uniref:glycosyltransferase family 2 protein n=1 Tax=Candidatus Symbiothrix dinenymphae TaxID=467085 RepID=UPI0006C522E2|nr:glycosyltransferase family 2 protein [Candidatus Symbiothrix dinenymphae]GAP71239.1 glycosyltransferase [Candidatus Symbiothrix dinenymphae]